MTREFVRSVLQEHARSARPAQVDLWPIIKQRTEGQTPSMVPTIPTAPAIPGVSKVPNVPKVSLGGRRRSLPVPVPASRLAWAVALMLFFVVAAAVTYAIGPLFPTVSIGVEHLQASGLGKDVHLSQTVDEYTVTLDWVYADGNDVLVRYSISPSATGSGLYAAIAPPVELRDEGGRLLPTIAGGLQTGSRQGMGPTYAVFDAAGIKGAPASLKLRLTLHVQGRTSFADMRTRVAAATTTPGSVVRPPEKGALAGPFTFEFTVPFIPARVAHPNESVTQQNVTVTLDELRVAPSEARATVRYAHPEKPAGLDWRPTMSLEVGNRRDGMDTQGNLRIGMGARGGPTDDGRWYNSWPAIPSDSPEIWKVSVTELIGYDAQLDPQVTVSGPWTFQVDLPQANSK